MVFTSWAGISNSAGAQSVDVAGSFSDFYDSRSPKLNAHFSDVRFEAAIIDDFRVFYSRGVVGETGYLSETGKVVWMDGLAEGASNENIAAKRENALESVEWVDVIRGNGRLRLTPNSKGSQQEQSFSSIERTNSIFALPLTPVAILGPTWSISIGTPYSCFINEPDIELVSFGKGANWRGRRTRLLQYRYRPYGERVFESTFDERTGVCLIEKGYSPYQYIPQAFRMKYLAFGDSDFPNLVEVLDDSSDKRILYVMDVERNAGIQEYELMGGKYGIQEADFPQAPVRFSAKSFANVLIFVATFATLLILFFAAIVFFVKRSAKKTNLS